MTFKAEDLSPRCTCFDNWYEECWIWDQFEDSHTQTFMSDISVQLSRRNATETALIFIANHFEMVKKRKGSGISSLVQQGSSVSGHWILKPLDRRSNLIDLQRFTVFLISDQPEKTLGSVRLKCKFFLFFNLPLVLRGYKSICWQRTSVHSIAGTLNCHEMFNAS